MKIIAQGAEAIIIKTKEIFGEKRFSDPENVFTKDYCVIKKRISKGYWFLELDNKIRKGRIKR